MGDWEKADQMKNRRTNLETVPPDTDRPDSDKPEAAHPMGRPSTPHKEARLGREVQARIGQQLRAMYDEVVNQGVPPHIADLIRRLSDQD